MACKTIKKQANKICISKLNAKIEIQTSSFQNADAPGEESSLVFNTISTTWSMVKTANNLNYNNGVNADSSITHLFYIRFNPSMDFFQELFILYKNRRFNVNSIENIDEENKYFVLYAVERGKDDKLASQR